MHTFIKIYFWNKTPHVSDTSSVHHQQFFTVHTAMVYVLTACEQDQDGTSCQQICVTYNIAVCTVKKKPDDGQRNCPKHVEYYSKKINLRN